MSEITGKLIVKNETQTFGANGFQKRTFVLETDDKYPQQVELELVKDKCALLDALNIGNVLTAAYNLNGRAWVNPQGETKYFNSVQAWKLDKVSTGQTPPPPPEFNPNADDQDPPF